MNQLMFCHLPSFCPPPTWPPASRLTTTIPIPIIVCRLTRLKRSNFLREKSLHPRIWFMRNSDNFNKIKNGNRCSLEWWKFCAWTNDEVLFLDYGPDLRQCCAFSRLLPWPPSFTDIPDLLYFPIILRRGRKAYTSEKQDPSFRAKLSRNSQDLDESVGKLVYKLNDYWK